MKKYIKSEHKETKEIYIIDPNTGEIMNFDNENVWVQTESDRAKAKEFFDAMKQKQEINELYKNYGRFIWNIYNMSEKSFPNLKPSNITRLMFIATYIGYEGYLVDYKNTPLSKHHVFKLLNLSEREFRSFYSAILQENIIIEKDNKIYINEGMFKKGEMSSIDIAKLSSDEKYITRIYINGVRNLYRKATVKSHKTLSYMFQILPYVNREYNIVCHNPLETDLDKVQKMTLGEFCDIIGYEKHNISRLCRTLFDPMFEVNGEIKSAMRYVGNKGTDKNYFSMFINPKVYYAGSRWDEVEVLGAF